MSEKSDIARLETILDFIEDINKIIKRHGTTEKALDDFEGQYALMMCIQQIGELLNKIQAEKYKIVLPIKDAVGFRNIAHNYDGINYQIAELTIDRKIPELKAIIQTMLENNGKN